MEEGRLRGKDACDEKRKRTQVEYLSSFRHLHQLDALFPHSIEADTNLRPPQTTKAVQAITSVLALEIMCSIGKE